MNYYPYRRRCLSCAKYRSNQSCRLLPFRRMPIYRQDGVDAVVLCTLHEPAPNSERAESRA